MPIACSQSLGVMAWIGLAVSSATLVGQRIGAAAVGAARPSAAPRLWPR